MTVDDLALWIGRTSLHRMNSKHDVKSGSPAAMTMVIGTEGAAQ